jgi:hypothetical protein
VALVARVAKAHSLRPVLTADAGRRLLVSVVASLATLVAAGVVASLDLWPDEWAPGASIAGLVGGLGPTAGRVWALACVAAAALTALRGWRREPKSIGHFVTAAAGFAFALVMVSAAGGASPGPSLVWALAAGAAGGGVIAIRYATDAWLDELRGNSAMYGAAAAAAFVVARLLVR